MKEAFLGAENANPIRIFKTVELPILESNPLVTRINYLDQKSLEIYNTNQLGIGY